MNREITTDQFRYENMQFMQKNLIHKPELLNMSKMHKCLMRSGSINHAEDFHIGK